MTAVSTVPASIHQPYQADLYTLLTRINVVATWKLSAPGESGEPRIIRNLQLDKFAADGLAGLMPFPLEFSLAVMMS